MPRDGFQPADNKAAALVDAGEVRRALALLLPTRQVTELRALDATLAGERWSGTVSGYFDDGKKLVAALASVTSAKGVYMIPNPVNPALLARAANRVKRAGKGETTSDHDITSRRWLLVDADPVRPAGISANDAEHEAALDRARAISRHLCERGWPDPVAADSGNGAHLLYRVDLPVDDGGLVERCLAALAARFDDAAVKVDQTVFNPARIWKLYGTRACKGDSTAERPHRMARILSVPEPTQVVDRAMIESLAAEATAVPTHEPKQQTDGQPFDVESFVVRHGFDVDGPEPWQGGRRWVFRQSPMCDHHDGAAFLLQHASGALSAGCHHHSCSWTWHDLRGKYEPRATAAANTPARRKTERAIAERAAPFPVEVLPGPAREFVSAAAKAIGCDPSFVALPLLACLARAIGNKRVVRLKRTWSEPAILWAAIVGKSGTHKTPAMQAAVRFLDRRQSGAIAAHVEAMRGYAEDKTIYDRDYAAWKRTKKAPAEPPPWPPVEPHCERFITTDTTIEALAAILAAQSDGLLVSRDELAGWLGGIAEYKGGKGSDLGHWLACWSAVPLTVDRKTGAVKMLHVPHAAVSIVGGIQPGVLRAAIGREHLQDGLCARLLLAMPEPRPVTWTEAIVDPATEAALARVFDRLLALEPAADEEGQPIPFPLPLTPEAMTVWVAYYNRHRAELVELDDDLAAAWSKLEAYTARFALVFQLVAWAAGEADGEAVDQASMESAITLSDWFGGEARQVYGLFAESEEDRQQRELVELIRRKGGAVTARDLMRSSRQWATSGEAESALDRLAKAGWGAWDIVATATNQRREFRLLTPLTPTDSSESREIRECVSVNAVNGAPAHATPIESSTRDTRVATDDYAYLLPGSQADRDALDQFERERQQLANEGDRIPF